MKIAVAGLGAIGLWLAGRLLAAGHEVRCFARGRLIWDHHIKNNAVGIQLKGRLDIEPGHMIKVLVPEMKVEEDKKKKLSEQYGGNYFVQAVSHIIQDDVLNTSMTLYKFDWS